MPLKPEKETAQADENREQNPDNGEEAATAEQETLSEEALANMERYGVKNPKGRAASVFSLVLWSLFLVMLILKGDWSMGPLLLAVLFVLLLLLTGVRLVQEWKENGDWLE